MALKLNPTPRRASVATGACPFPGRLVPSAAPLPSQRRRLSSPSSSPTIVHSIAPPSSASSSSSSSPAPRRVPSLASTPRSSSVAAAAAAAASASPSRGLVQHKAEARIFYRFLSIVYDKIVNPGHWTVPMREAALEPARLKSIPGASQEKIDTAKLLVADVGGGTGFCTQGVVAAGVPPANVTLVDQSPHQMAKAKAKPDLQGVTFLEGDAEDLPLPTDAFDRYTSAGSIEYWPEPQRGVCEAYRILKPGGWACLIGPVEPTNPVSKFFQALWMLFPSEQNYLDWFRAAGFVDVELHRIGPKWYRGVRRHGLIMGCSVVGRKPASGQSPLAGKLGPKEEVSGAPAPLGIGAKLALASRVILGSAAGFYYFVLPIYFWIKNLIWPRWLPGF